MLHEILMMTSPNDDDDNKPDFDVWDVIIVIGLVIFLFGLVSSFVFA